MIDPLYAEITVIASIVTFVLAAFRLATVSVAANGAAASSSLGKARRSARTSTAGADAEPAVGRSFSATDAPLATGRSTDRTTSPDPRAGSRHATGSAPRTAPAYGRGLAEGMSTGHGTDDATGQRLGSGRRATTVSRDSGGRFAGVNTSPPPGYRTRPLGHSQDRTAPYERESFYPEHRQVCWRGQLPTTGPVIARVGFLARTIELRRMTLMSAAIVAVEPGGAETLLGSIAWDAQYADHIDWSDNPARHSLIANGTMDMFWLDQRLRAAVERFFHNRHVPTRFIDPREEPVTHAG